MNTFVRFLYSLIIAGSIVAFVGFGIYAFYPGPDAGYGDCYEDQNYTKELSDSEFKTQRAEEKACVDKAEAKDDAHAENVTMIGLAVTAIVGTGYLYLNKTKAGFVNEVVMDGLGLGLIGLSFYSLIWSGIAGPHRVLMFVSVLALLVSAVGVGYLKFTDNKH